MKSLHLTTPAILAAAAFTLQIASAQLSTPPATEAEKEEIYTAAIEGRTADILNSLNLTNETKSAAVHDLIIAQYRILRSRDALIDAQIKAVGQEPNYANRAAKVQAESKVLHDHFFAKLSEFLTPGQVETVKDKLTYNKVKVTFDAYCAIVSGLTDAEKAKIIELLKAAREEAVDGGSAPEKAEIFQKYKNQINTYLTANGHDVAKAFKDWEANQTAAKSSATGAK